MDAVEAGRSFTVTRDGHEIGELIPCDGVGASSLGLSSPRCRTTPQSSMSPRSARTRPLRSIMKSSIRMAGSAHDQGLVDTNVLILRRWVDPTELPNEMAISAVTLAELSAGPHQVRPNSEQDSYDEHTERARRLDVLQRAEHEFDPIPFTAEAARAYGRVAGAVVSVGRKPRRRTADLMIAVTAIAEDLPLFTTNPDGFDGLAGLLTVVPVTRPPVTRDDRTTR